MFQTFENSASPAHGAARLASLRAVMEGARLDGFLIPRADAHQGEYVAPCDERLAWLTGFTGSAGFAVALKNEAGVFIDGRYTVQVRSQIDLKAFSPVAWPATQLGTWLSERTKKGQKIGFDPWLHTKDEIDAAQKKIDAVLTPAPNLIDRIWDDRPARPSMPAEVYPDNLAGKTSTEKREEIASEMRDAGQSCAVITLPDSIAWLLNIRGADIARIPIVQAFSILHNDGRVQVFTDIEKFSGVSLDAEINAWDDFEDALSRLEGPVRVDPKSAPVAIWSALETAGTKIEAAPDPCILPKACKTEAEIQGSRTAHIRDAAAMVEFLTWLDGEGRELEADDSHQLTEIDVVTRLEGFRRATNVLKDISFETISGAGPNGAIVHYRVTDDSNRALQPGELLLVDSGGQYLDGTTDITRTVAIGPVGESEKRAFTLVLKGVIALSTARWPVGIAGRDLDVLARTALWAEGMDYDHGTGHGVGAYLSVHEGPQRISRVSHEPLQAGMILSNEPGYYSVGKFGIRIENLIVVQKAAPLAGGDEREMLDFETLTWVPIDKNLIDQARLTSAEIDWLNDYHAEIARKLDGNLSEDAASWLAQATAPI